MPSCQQVAPSGSGLPPQRLQAVMASAWLIGSISVWSARGTGSTFSDTSEMSPRMPIEPVSSREKS